MKAFLSFLSLLSTPISILNLFGGAVAGIWLAILGEWWIIFQGIGLLIFGHVWISLWLMPSMFLFGVPSLYLLERGIKPLAYLLVVLNQLYTAALITAWCVGLMLFFCKDASKPTIIPLLLWSYVVATGPWAYLAYHDQQAGGNEFSMIATLFAELAFILMAIYVLFGRVAILSVVTIFGSVMLISIISQTYVAIATERSKHGYA